MRPHILFLASVLGCDSDTSVKTVNSNPEVSITSHSEGAQLLEGYSETFRGIVTDNNHGADELVARWYSGDIPLCDAMTPESDGLIQCTVDISSEFSEIRLQVQDPQNAVGVAAISVNVSPTGDPSAEILSPTPEGSYYSDQLVFFSAVIQDPEDASEDLEYLWRSSLDGDLPITVQPESSGEVQQYMGLSPGQHAITLTVTDSSNKTTSETVAVIVGGENQEPTCSIELPMGGSVFTLGQAVSFSGTAIDADINNTDLQVQWSSSIDGLIDETTANTDGSLAFVYDALSAGNHTIQLQVSDEVDELCQDSVLLTIGTPPTLTLTGPQDGSLYLTADSVIFEGTVSDSEDIASDVEISWNSDRDGLFSTLGSDSNGNIYLSYNNLSPGSHSIVVTATDTSGLTDSSSLSLQINTPPSAPTVTISPNPVYTTQTIQASASGSIDLDGDPVGYSYSWTQDGLSTSYVTSSVPSTATAAGEIWAVRVTPNDGYSDGAYTEQNVVIENSLPTIDSISISPNTATNDDVLTCSAVASDADQTLVPSYEWTVGVLTIAGPTLDLSSTQALPNDVVVCTANVTDNAGASASSSASLVVENRPPTLSNISITPSSAFTNSVLSCSASSSDIDGETTTETIDWQVNGLSVGGGSTLVLDNTLVSVGETVECQVTVTDPSGESASLTTGIAIQNIAPTLTAFDLSPINPTAVDVVTCSAAASDADSDVLNTLFTWENLTDSQGYSSTVMTNETAELDLTQVSITPGDTLQCTVAVSDPHGGLVAQSASVVVLNSAPVFDVPVTIDPNTSVTTNTDLFCDATVTDPNDGPLTPTYEWSVNGVFLVSGQYHTVSALDTDVGEFVVCTATATDSDGETTVDSASIEVENTPPLVSGVTLSHANTLVYNDEVVNCTATVTDPDEALTPVYSWTVAGAPVGTGPSLDLVTTPGMPNDTVTCYATAVDASGETHTASDFIVLDNRPPSAPIVVVSPSDPVEGIDDLYCSGSGSVDPDDPNGTPTYSYEWLSDSNVSVSGPSVSASLTAEGEVWTCTVSASDGSLESSSVGVVVVVADGINGTVRHTNGSWIDVSYEYCGGSCNASQSKAACTAVGKKVVSHASNGTSEVYSLEASSSCQHSVSYYTIDQSMNSNQCLIGISNLEWSGCCGTSSWHGRTIPFSNPGTTFGYVYSSNSGYDGSISTTNGSPWGCHSKGTPASGYGSCNEFYVACAY